jgi:hypothetical protein
MKFYTKKLQQQNRLLEDYFISHSLKESEIRKLIDNHRKCFEEDCPNVCWCFLVEDILDS